MVLFLDISVSRSDTGNLVQSPSKSIGGYLKRNPFKLIAVVSIVCVCVCVCVCVSAIPANRRISLWLLWLFLLLDISDVVLFSFDPFGARALFIDRRK